MQWRSKMAEKKKEGFILFTGMYSAIRDLLTFEQKGMLFEAINDYCEDGKEPQKNSPIAIAFAFYKNQFRLNNGRDEVFVEKQRKNGSMGGRPRKNPNETQINPNNPSLFPETQKTPNKEHRNKKDKQETKEYSLSENERPPDFDGQKLAKEFQEVYRLKAGKPRPMETAFAQCLIRMKEMGAFANYIEANEMLTNRAAQFMTYHIRAGTETRFIPNPETWLDDDSWKIDWHQKAIEYKNQDQKNIAKGGIQNGKSTRADEARAYADAAKRHAEASGL
jgi:hypothetical protein